MKNVLIAAVIAVIAATAVAQNQEPVAATINGEIITRAKLDALYAAMPPQIREQYDQAGGKRIFLDNYIAKRLILQEAAKAGFAERPEVKAAPAAARESVMFNSYIREVISAPIVPESAVRRLYDDRVDQFVVPEKVKVRHIFLSFEDKRPEQALEQAQRIFSELQAHRVSFHADSPEGRTAFAKQFALAARKYSDDPSAKDGGELGWIARGQRDRKFEEAAFTVPAGVMSGIVGTDSGYHFILVEEKQAAGVIPFDEVKGEIREAMLAQKQSDIMAAVTRVSNDLRAKGNVVVYTANVD